MKILIADDELYIRQGLEKLDWNSLGLKMCGAAKNGAEAIELAISTRPDIILSDIRMPNMDGLDMAEQFLQINPRCAIIFLTGYREFEYARKAIALGAFDYLLKPTNPEEIMECCERAVKEVRQQAKQDVTFVEMKSRIKDLEVKMGAKTEDPFPAEQEELGKCKVSEILLYIDNHFHEELSLQTLSEVFHFNTIYINRLIKKETGYTFLEIVNNRRMSQAASYLKKTDKAIGEIAMQIGIPDQRYFSQIFKKYFGYSPRQYRKLR